MAICSYNGRRIIPAPFVSISKSFQKTGDGEIRGAGYNLTLRGQLLAFKGSPTESGVFYTGSRYDPDGRTEPTYTVGINEDSRLNSILRKQEAIRELFSEEGHSLEFQAFDGSPAMKCNPRIDSIEFEEGVWYDVCRYTIQCDTDVLYVNGQSIDEDGFTQYISESDESWGIETREEGEGLGLPRTYVLTHNVSAKGKRFYQEDGTLESPAWEQARKYVLPKLGMDNAFVNSSGIKDLPSYYGGYNHIRKEDIGKENGTYAVTESWILASGNALESFSISVSKDSRDGLSKVSIDGNITGLEERNSNMVITSSKYDNALSKFNTVSGVLFARAQTYSGITLNIQPALESTGRNPIAGTINYKYDFDNRPANFIPGAKSQVISINNSWNVDTFAAIFVLGRANGPVLQSLGTKEAKRTSLTMEIVFNPPTLSSSSVSAYQGIISTQNPRFTSAGTEIQKIVDAVNPLNNGYSTAFVSSQEETWEPTSGRYGYKIEYIYE